MHSIRQKVCIGLAAMFVLLAAITGVAAKVGIDAYDYYSSMTLCGDNAFGMVPITPGGCIGNTNEPGIDGWLSDNIDSLVLLSMIGVSGCLSLLVFIATFEARRQDHYGAMIAGIISEFLLASVLYMLFLNHFIGNFLNPGLSSYTFHMMGSIDVGLWVILSVLLALLYVLIGSFAYMYTKGRRVRAALLLLSLMLLAITLIAGQQCLPS